MNDTPATAIGHTAAAGDTAFAAAIKAAQDDIHSGVEKAGLRNDPIRYPLAAISTALGLFPDFLRQMQDTAEQARQPLDAAALARMEKAAAEGASRASGALVRAHNRRSVLIGTLTVAAAVAGALGGGYWWGHSAAIMQFRLAESGFADIAHDSPADATGWFNLARLNEYQPLMQACRGDRGFVDASGRRACMAPLWLEPPKADAPPQSGAKAGGNVILPPP